MGSTTRSEAWEAAHAAEVAAARLYPGDVEDALPETSLAFALTIYLVQALERLVARPGLDSVFGNFPIYYREGEPRRHVSPDVCLVRSLTNDPPRRSYRLWEIGRPPEVVFEIVSRGSELKDTDVNRALYQELGVAEYFWFNPDGPELVGLRLAPGRRRYRPILADPAGRLPSPELGLEVGLDPAGLLCLFLRGQPVPGLQEVLERERKARLRERAARLRAEAELEREREDRERAQKARDREQRAREREREARERAEAELERERKARTAQEQELERQRAELAALRARLDDPPGP